ncbi:LTA synthase family protein [Pedobacter nutrimenti]|uniref:Phosphoglycerol transferase MdoB-like AlkP superfamily enzyme n=1 Tax=Pedobacter nutrimenti TaxID=1241337 RepID=A0A318UBJ1_9SPHI|nr:alkaline phosphatase family protein [Pedobacter nutrimenti]PYF72903.1 phosphoglycerol transferase MdoB-like AlkP superfamily enzyme [Pedobacter nutrimenti]
MLKSLLFFLRLYLFWLLFFFTDRLLFLVFYHQKLNAIGFGEILSTFYNALPIDLSTAGYITAIPLLVYIYWLFRGRFEVGMKWLSVYNIVLIVLFSLISVINFNIYREWGTKLNAKAIGFAFSSPNESIASGASSPVAPNLLLLFLMIATGLVLQRFLVSKKLKFVTFPLWAKTGVSFLLLFFNFFLIRGGLGATVMNQSSAYFSDKIILNHAAVNTEWNLFASVVASLSAHKNKYLFYDKAQSEQEVADLYTSTSDSTINILNTKRPNVILFIMESFTADLTKTLGNYDDVTPHFDSLVNKGVLFSKIYSTGNRTDKGIIGTLAGFPSLAAGNLVKYTSKMTKLPAISQEFRKAGYSTAFYYGGESEFDNYKAFILNHGYQKLIDKNKFKTEELTSKWGAYDGVVFNRQLTELKKTAEPFFSTTMTLTNHEPFEVPGSYKFGKEDNIQRFKSTAFYTDSCINDFLLKAKSQPWYKNTLFIFIADHGHILPKETNEVYMPQRYHIPLLLYGEVIKPEFRGKKFDRIGSQIDLASTLLGQLQMNSKQFTWSKNLLNPNTKEFAFFSWDNGLGFVKPGQTVTFDNTGKTVLYNDDKKDKKKTDETLRSGKSYLQKVYQQFIEL